MANLREQVLWETSVYQIEKLDPVVGGADGVTNRPIIQLANRTQWLKRQFEFVQNTARPLSLDESSTNTIDSTGHTHLIAQASTRAKGIVRLNDTLSSNSDTEALTAKQGKILDDKVNTKLNANANAVSASKLQTPRQINLTGDATGQTTFDGSANVGIGVTLANTGVTAGTYQSVAVDSKGRVTAGQTVVNSLITATTATGTANQATGNSNTYLNLVTRTGSSTSSQGSSTKITGVNGISVSSDTAGALTVSGTRASDTDVGVVQLSHSTNGTDKTKAASEFALGEVRRLANQANVAVNGIALTWNNVQQKPVSFPPSAHRHNWSEIDNIPSATTAMQGITQLNNTLTSQSTTQALTAAQGKVLNDKINALDDNKVPLRGVLDSRNLNDLTALNYQGLWQQSSNSNATSLRNYPTTKAGSLWVLPSAYDGQQMYIPFDENVFYKRTKMHNGNWSEWKAIGAIENTLNSNDGQSALSANMGKVLKGELDTLNQQKLNKTDNAVSSSKLATARTISLTGDGAWNVNFDGSQNATGAFTLANTGVTAGSYNAVTVDAKGRVTAGLSQTMGLVTATTATGTANTATTNTNTYLNIVASGVGRTASVGSSTQITGTNGLSVSSDTAGRVIITQDDTLKTINYNQDKSSQYQKTGFYRADDLQFNGKFVPKMAMHITHPQATGNAHARGIGFGYGGHNWHISTTAWNERGEYLGEKKIYTEEDSTDSLTTNSSQMIATAKAVKQLNDTKLGNSGHQAITNGSLTINNQKVWLYNDRSDETNLDDTTKIATSRAVKRLNDAKLGKTENAVSASKLQTARNIALTGAVTGSVDFDGSQNVSMATALNLSGNIAILTGTANHGETLPIPDGFNESQCKFFVSMRNSNPNNNTWDIPEHSHSNHFHIQCYVNGRTVYATITLTLDNGRGYGGSQREIPAVANYMVIAIK